MSTGKHLDAICLVALVVCILLTGLVLAGKAYGEDVDSGEEDDSAFSSLDRNGTWDTSGATRISLEGDEVRMEGSGAYWADGVLHIAYGGHYVLSGELTDGSIEVDTGSDGQVWLMLDGVTLHCEDSAALLVKQAEKVFLTLAEGSVNTVSCGETFREDAAADGIDGAIYARDDLTINGSGSLTVSGASAHALVCNDNLVITGGTLDLTAAEDGIHANDSVRLTDMDLTIHAGDDGVTVSNDDDSSFFLLDGGTVSIPSCYEGIEAPTVTVNDGILTISPTDDGINASGLNPAGCAIHINGGEITIVNETGRDADGLDSNGSIYIAGGITLVSVNGSGSNAALDAGTESGGVCEVSGGTILACGGSMMAEGFDSTSTQGFLMHTTTALTEAGTTVTLTGADGTVLCSEQVPCAFTCLVLSAPGMAVGDTCTLAIGDTEEEVTIDNASTGGGFGFGGGMGGRHGGMGGMDGMDRGTIQKGQRTFPSDGQTAPSEDGNTSSSGESGASSTPATIAASSSAPALRLLSAAAPSQGDGTAAPTDGNGMPSQPPAGDGTAPQDSAGSPPQPPDGFQGDWPGSGNRPFQQDGQTAFSASSSSEEGETPPPSSSEESGSTSSSAPAGGDGTDTSEPAAGQNPAGTAPTLPDGTQLPEDFQRPNGQMDPNQFGGRGQRQDWNQTGGNPRQNGGQASADSSSVTPEALLLTGISTLVLLVGLVIAIRFRP